MSKKTIPRLLSLAAFLLAPLPVFACSDLSNFYRDVEDKFLSIENELGPLLEECSESSEYFALLGTVQLRSGSLFNALENLELALLLDSTNGSALLDYAEVLYRQGQVVNALDINAQLLAREDLPEGLEEVIISRQRRWRQSASETSSILSASVGYDDNLNSAPIDRQLALTLSGQSVVLDVGSEFLAAAGPYANVAAGVARNKVGRDISSRISGQVRGRFSEDSSYELLQASSQFALAESGDNPRWNVIFGLDHLNYGGHSIFSSSTMRASYLVRQGPRCRIYPRLALQYQFFHMQESLSGAEASVGAGADCQLSIGETANRIAFEVTALTNRASKSNRLGSDRNGWQVNLVWQRQFGPGQALAQFVHTDLNDDDGYSPIFNNGARRKESLSTAYFQYAFPVRGLGAAAQVMTSVSYRTQSSTIALFRTKGVTAEIGINWGF